MNHYLYSGLAGMLLLFYELKTAKRPQATKVYDTLKNEMFIYTENGIRSFKNLDSVRLDFMRERDLSFMRICVCIKEAMNRFICDMLKNIPKLLENY